MRSGYYCFLAAGRQDPDQSSNPLDLSFLQVSGIQTPWYGFRTLLLSHSVGTLSVLQGVTCDVTGWHVKCTRKMAEVHMAANDRNDWMQRYKLTEEKIEKMMSRAVQACLAYEKGKMTLKQVWYRARGYRFNMACQLYHDRQVGRLLWELATDFDTNLDSMDFVIRDSIFRVIESVKAGKVAIH